MSESKYYTLGIVMIVLVAVVGLGLAIYNNAKPKKPIADAGVNTDLVPQDIVPKEANESTATSDTLNTVENAENVSAIIKTNKGDITVTLHASKTPLTVQNFTKLASEGFYNGVKFHRVIKDFMIQAGDPKSKDDSLKAEWGTGGPGYTFDDEPFEGEYTRGVLAMANSGPDTNGSQFFIMHADKPLPKNYVIFGEVADEASLAVVDAIANTPVEASRSGEPSVPTEALVIESVVIL